MNQLEVMRIGKYSLRDETRTDFDYEDKEKEFKIMKSPEQRKLLAKEVDSLVKRVEKEDVSNLIFLDKSARPPVTLFQDLWKHRYPQKPAPHISFLNIGRETDARQIDQAELDRIKQSYKYLKEAKSGSKAMIIEECTLTGQSLEKAQDIISSAFPDILLSVASITKFSDIPPVGSKDVLFWDSKEEELNPPWRYSIFEYGYGMAGVVDPAPGKLTAESTNLFDQDSAVNEEIFKVEAERKQKIEQYPQVLQEAIAGIDILAQYQFSIPESASDKEREVGRRFQNYFNSVFVPILIKIRETATVFRLQLLNKKTISIQDIINLGERTEFNASVEAYQDEKEELLIARFLNSGNSTIDSIREINQNIFGQYLDSLLGQIKLNIGVFLTDMESIDSYYRERIQKLRAVLEKNKMVSSVELAGQLRREMHMIADEYIGRVAYPA